MRSCRETAEKCQSKKCRSFVDVLTARPVITMLKGVPGAAPRNHRTDSIDYAVVMSGEIDMEMDDTVVHLKAGDVLVQRVTIHNWVNNGTAPCVIAFVLMGVEGDTAVG